MQIYVLNIEQNPKELISEVEVKVIIGVITDSSTHLQIVIVITFCNVHYIFNV